MPATTVPKLPFPDQIQLADPALEPALRAVSFRLVRAVFDSDAAMAEAFGVDRSNMGRWKNGAPLSHENAARLQAIEVVVSLLLGFLSPTTIPKWLRGVNAHLGDRRPIDVLLNGRLSEVVAAIENEQSGAYA